MGRLSAALMVALMLSAPAMAQRRSKRQPARPPVQVPLAAAPQPVVPSVRNGAELWRRGEWAAAVQMWRPFADAGNADAMFNMGQAYKLGRGVPKEETTARGWYQRAAGMGHRPAQANLGIMLFQARDMVAALRWLKLAADAGEPRAQYVLGVAHWNGDGVTASLTLAYAYLARAADQGLAEARTAIDLLTPKMSVTERTAGWQVARDLARSDGTRGPLESIPDPGGAAVAAAPVPAPVPQTPSVNPAARSGEAVAGPLYRIQLGAYSRPEQADAALAAIRARSPAVVAGLEPVIQTQGPLTRLQLGRFASLEAARAGCARVVAAGYSCLTVEVP